MDKNSKMQPIVYKKQLKNGGMQPLELV